MTFYIKYDFQNMQNKILMTDYYKVDLLKGLKFDVNIEDIGMVNWWHMARRVLTILDAKESSEMEFNKPLSDQDKRLYVLFCGVGTGTGRWKSISFIPG